MKKAIFISLASLAMLACVQENFDTSDDAPVVASFEASRDAFQEGSAGSRRYLPCRRC